ncbi:MAG: hypothetical protein Q8P67_19060, partial [archaeon]|nr:hypothetical protein [archaeon]
GDGANDVGMIQEAHIGIGIFGREGSEAARSSDYALREFKHLKRLLCVHGRYALIRNAGLSLYSLYKNAAIFLSQIWFSFFSVASAQTLYDEWIMTFFNIIFTSWPPLIYGCLEKDIDERIIDLYPETYQRTQQNRLFTLAKLTEWMVLATWHSVVLYFGTMGLISWTPSILTNGQGIGLNSFGQMTMNVGIVVIFLKLIMETLEWNWIVHLSMWGSISLYIIIIISQSVWLTAFPEEYWVFFNLVQYSPVYWLWFLCAIVVCLLPDLVLKMVRTYFFPEDWQLLREHYHFHPEELSQDPHLPVSINYLDDPDSDHKSGDQTPLFAPSSLSSTPKSYGTQFNPSSHREVPLSPSTPFKINSSKYHTLQTDDDDDDD